MITPHYRVAYQCHGGMSKLSRVKLALFERRQWKVTIFQSVYLEALRVLRSNRYSDANANQTTFHLSILYKTTCRAVTLSANHFHALRTHLTESAETARLYLKRKVETSKCGNPAICICLGISKILLCISFVFQYNERFYKYC